MGLDYFILAFLGLLISVVAFFLRQLVGKFDKIEEAVNRLNEKIAVMMAHQDHYKKDMEQRILFESRIDKEIKDLRSANHDTRNIMNGIVGKLELMQETCKRHGGKL